MRSYREELADIFNEYSSMRHKKEEEDFINSVKDKEVILYGAGGGGYLMYMMLKEKSFGTEKIFGSVKITAYCDTYKRGTDDVTGLKIISRAQLLAEHPKSNVIVSVASVKMSEEIKQSLVKQGFKGKIIPFERATYDWYQTGEIPSERLIEHVKKYEALWESLNDDESRRVLLSLIRMRLLHKAVRYSDNQVYFEKEIIKLTDDEVFVDGGFYIGDTSMALIRNSNGNYKHIYGFEPDIGNAVKYTGEKKKLTIVDKGLWECDDTLRFSSGLLGNSGISENGSTDIAVTSIDNYFADNPHKPTFIKMDIEGAEKQALLGAKEILKKYKPKLAISAYHKPDDLYELPEVIMASNKDYKLYVRHHSLMCADTILYAV